MSVTQHDIEYDKVMVFKYIQIVLCICVLITGVVGNILIITSLSKPWKKLKSFEILVLSLSVSDLLFSLANPTQSILNLWGFGRAYGDVGCRIHYWIAKLASTASAWVLMVIAIDRFIVIVLRPLLSADGRKWKTLMVIFATWIISGSFAVVYVLPIKIYKSGELFVCRLFYKSLEEDHMHTITVFLTDVAFPCLVTTPVCFTIILRLRKLQPIGNNERALEVTRTRNKKAIKLLAIVVVVFYLLIVPNQIFYLIYTFSELQNTNTVIYTVHATGLLYSIHGCINPFIYSKVQPSFILSAFPANCFRRCRGQDQEERAQVTATQSNIFSIPSKQSRKQ